MHELAVCQALMRQVESIAAGRGARAAERITVAVGPLSGVEPALLTSAFTIARQGTLAGNAELEIETPPLEVECRTCGHRGEARPNRLLCPVCDDWQVRIASGDELMLLRVDLVLDEAPAPSPLAVVEPETAHV